MLVTFSSSESESLPRTSNISFSRSFSKSSSLFRWVGIGSDAADAAEGVDAVDVCVDAGDASIDAGNKIDVCCFLFLRFSVMVRCIDGRSKVNLYIVVCEITIFLIGHRYDIHYFCVFIID